VTIGFGKGLFRGAVLLYATAAESFAPAIDTSEHIPIDRLYSARSRSLTAARLTYRAACFVCFSPAFIFDNLSRGPPAPL
jgi:hypothetical protein